MPSLQISVAEFMRVSSRRSSSLNGPSLSPRGQAYQRASLASCLVAFFRSVFCDLCGRIYTDISLVDIISAMSRLWKMMLGEAIAYSIATISACIAIMLVAMSREIVRMAALSGEIATTANFILLQIPYLLPYTLILSSFITCYAVCARLSENHEFIALRAAGFSLRAIMAPLIWWSMLLGACNFILCSELAPVARLRSKLLIEEIARQRPLSLLQQERLLSRNIGWLGNDVSSDAHRLALILEEPSGEPLLMVIDNLEESGRSLTAAYAAVVRPPSSDDRLLVESSIAADIDREALASQLLKSPLQDADDYAAWRHFWQRAYHSPSSLQELIRRSLLASLAPLLGILGALYGISSTRHRSRWSLAPAAAASLLSLIACVVMRSLPPIPWIFFSVTLAPLTVIAILVLIRRIQITRGLV